MSCGCPNAGEVEWTKNVVNRLDYTFYEDNPPTVLEDLSGKVFSVVVFHPTNETEVYARAIGDTFDGAVGKVELLEFGEEDVESRIKATFPVAALADAEWDLASWLIHDITDPANPEKKLTGMIRLSKGPTPSVPETP